MQRMVVPQLDANLVDVTVTAWHKACGDSLEIGEPVVELTTDKAAFDLESHGSGRLLKILAVEKSIVPVGYVLGVVGEPGEEDAEAEGDNRRLMDAYRQRSAGLKPATSDASAQTPRDAGATRVRATPRARRLARQYQLDLTEIRRVTGVEVVDEATLTPFLPGNRG